MKKITILLALCSANIASADPIVLRTASNRYAVQDGTVVTKDCTVTADGALKARIERVRGRRWITFIDRDGEEEGQCEVRLTVSRPRAMVARR
jgi:hypothetical protein